MALALQGSPPADSYPAKVEEIMYELPQSRH